jgi:hypothetical protein
MSGDHEKAMADYQVAASQATSSSEEDYLRERETRLRDGPEEAPS